MLLIIAQSGVVVTRHTVTVTCPTAVVAEVPAAELGADSEPAGQAEHLLLELAVAIGLAVAVALERQGVEIAAAGELDRLQIHLGRGAADHDREVVGRACSRAEGANFYWQNVFLKMQTRLIRLNQKITSTSY